MGTTLRENPLSKRALLVVLFVQLGEGFQLTLLFPFVAFMIASFEGIPEDQVGMFSGLVAAAFAFGQLCSSFVWGRFADRFGARPCVLISLFLTSICTTAFGFSFNVPMAIAIRLATGLCNGNLGVIKSYLGKVTDMTNQARAMSLLSAAWSIGTIGGPIVGGFLANPTQQYPSLFPPGGFFEQYPYLLPCIFAGAINLSAFIVCFFIMKEADAIIADLAALATDVPADPFYVRFWRLIVPKSQKYQRVELDQIKLTETQHDDDQNQIDNTRSVTTLLQSSSSLTIIEPFHYHPPSLKLVWFCTFMYGLVALIFIWIDELFPLFCRESVENDGLEFSSSEIGIVLGVLGGVTIVYNILIYPLLARRIGLMRMLRWSIACAIPVCLSYPLTYYIALLEMPGLLWTVLVLIMIVRGVVGLNMFTSVMVFVNNAVPRESMGMANGIGQSWASGVRAFGPAMGGLLWSLTANAHFPGHNFIVWIIVACLVIALLVLTRQYPETITKPFVKVPIIDQEPGEEEEEDHEDQR